MALAISTSFDSSSLAKTSQDVWHIHPVLAQCWADVYTPTQLWTSAGWMCCVLWALFPGVMCRNVCGATGMRPSNNVVLMLGQRRRRWISGWLIPLRLLLTLHNTTRHGSSIADRVPIQFGVTLAMFVWVEVSCLAPRIFFLTDVMWFTIYGNVTD